MENVIILGTGIAGCTNESGIRTIKKNTCDLSISTPASQMCRLTTDTERFPNLSPYSGATRCFSNSTYTNCVPRGATVCTSGGEESVFGTSCPRGTVFVRTIR